MDLQATLLTYRYRQAQDVVLQANNLRSAYMHILLHGELVQPAPCIMFDRSRRHFGLPYACSELHRILLCD